MKYMASDQICWPWSKTIEPSPASSGSERQFCAPVGMFQPCLAFPVRDLILMESGSPMAPSSRSLFASLMGA